MGTPAAEMNDIVGPRIKKERASELRAIGAELKESYMRSNLNRTLEVLIEESSSDKTFIGTSGNYLKTRVSVAHLEPGSIVNALILGMDDKYLSGKAV